MRMLLIVVVLLMSLFMIMGASAECERCSDSCLACVGDLESEVRAKCGPPARIVYYENIFHEIVAVKYYYDLGRGKFIRVFTFRHGVLSEIATGDRMK
jgi:hypothetical protein